MCKSAMMLKRKNGAGPEPEPYKNERVFKRLKSQLGNFIEFLGALHEAVETVTETNKSMPVLRTINRLTSDWDCLTRGLRDIVGEPSQQDREWNQHLSRALDNEDKDRQRVHGFLEKYQDRSYHEEVRDKLYDEFHECLDRANRDAHYQAFCSFIKPLCDGELSDEKKQKLYQEFLQCHAT